MWFHLNCRRLMTYKQMLQWLVPISGVLPRAAFQPCTCACWLVVVRVEKQTSLIRLCLCDIDIAHVELFYLMKRKWQFLSTTSPWCICQRYGGSHQYLNKFPEQSCLFTTPSIMFTLCLFSFMVFFFPVMSPDPISCALTGCISSLMTRS